MRVLVTGGSGFVGLAIAQAVREAGGQAVLLADRAPPEALRRATGVEEADVHIGDVRSRDAVDAALAAGRCSHAVHAAALTPALDTRLEEAPRIFDVNMGGTATVLAALAGRVDHVIHLSSVAVYGNVPPAEGPISETRPVSPVGLYGVSKVGAEFVVREAIRQTGLAVTLLRVGPVFGPFEYETGLRPLMSPHLQMLRLARAGRPAILPGRLAADWIYSANLGAAVVQRLATSKGNGALYNLGGGVVTDLLSWGAHLAPHFPGWSWRVAEAGEVPNIVYHFTTDRAAMDIAAITRAGAAHAFDLAAAARHYLAWCDDLPIAL